MTHHIHTERNDGVVILRIDRPPANAMELGMLEAFNGILASLATATDVAALVVTGAGDTFCAGLDLKIVPTYDTAQRQQLIASVNRLFTQLYGLSCPTVAAVNGHALAGGLLLALACDVRLCTAQPCKLGLPEVRVGVPYPEAAMRLAQAELSPALARRLVLGGESFGPAEAVEIGVFDEVVARHDLLARALDTARTRAALPRTMYGTTKQQLRSAALRDMRRVVEEAT